MKAGHQEIKVLLRYRFETSLSYKGSCLTKKERQGGNEGGKYLLNTNFGLPSSLCCTLTDPVASSEVVQLLTFLLSTGLATARFGTRLLKGPDRIFPSLKSMVSVVENTAPPWQPGRHKSKQKCNQRVWLGFKEASCAKPLHHWLPLP